MAAEVEAAERTRAPIDRGWTLSFIATLFAIHWAHEHRPDAAFDCSSPAVAVAGDMLIAVLFTLLVINPAYLLWRGPTRWIERGRGAGSSIAATPAAPGSIRHRWAGSAGD